MFRVNIKTTSTSIVSLVEFEQVNVCCDIIKSLINAVGLLEKCYASNVIHVHLISIGTMLRRTTCF